MGKYRKDRINEETAKVLSEAVRQIKDPRVAKHFITILRTEVTPDLKYAKVYYSVMGAKNEEIDHKELRAGFKSASGFLRGQMAQQLNLRITPELNFVYDESIAYGAKINAILHTDSVKEDIRRFDERAAKEAAEAAAAAAESAAESAAADSAAAGAENDDGEDEFDD